MEISEQLLPGTAEKSEQRFNNVVDQSIMGVAILVGPDMTVEFANQRIIDIWGKGSAVIGRTILELFPEIKVQPFPHLLNEVYTSGQAVLRI
jgi:hypothetical protein